MRAPEKKPLVNLEKDDRVPQLQRAEKVKQESPIQALSEFDTSETKRTRLLLGSNILLAEWTMKTCLHMHWI